MAAKLRPDLVASRYDGLPVGPTLAYSFETQSTVPVDGTRADLRKYSPFRLRLLPPDIAPEVSKDVNLIGRAGRTLEQQRASANAIRSLFGIDSVSGSGQAELLGRLQQVVSSGQIVSGATATTERAVITDRFTAADIAFQIERILQTPPLTLLVNPKEFSTNYSAVQQYSNRGRDGYIFERWGEAQPTISFSGSTGGFIAGSSTGFPQQTENTSATGLQFAAKRDSAAFQNFIGLYHFYRNNGYIFDLIGKTRAHHMVGAVAIDWDQWTYIGHINSFDFSYDENMPHRLEWSLEFTADRIIDNGEVTTLVQPMNAPQPNPANPRGNRGAAQPRRPDAAGTGGIIQVSGTEQFSETPLDLLIPTGVTNS